MSEPVPRTPPKIRRPVPAPLAPSPAVSELTAALAAAGADPDSGAAARARLVAGFWAAHPETPLLEAAADGQRTVTFLWRGDPDRPAEDVLLFVNRLTDERDLDASLMRHLPGTDIWHLSYRMSDTWRASYCFLPRAAGETWPWADEDQIAIRRALDRGLADPRNPEGCLNRAGNRLSVVQLPDAPQQPWLERREGLTARGDVTMHEAPGGRRVWVYRPPANAGRAAKDALPLVVLFDGEVWAGTQSIATTVDNLIADRLIRPCLIAMPETGGRDRRWQELDHDGRGGDWVATELLPWLRELAPVSYRADDIVVAGQSLGAYTALRCALEHTHLIGGVLSQSASLWQRELRTPLPGLLHRLHLYVEVGAQEWVLRAPNAALAARLAEAGADVHFVEYDGGHDYACWRGGIADGLRVLIGRPRPENTLEGNPSHGNPSAGGRDRDRDRDREEHDGDEHDEGAV